MRRNEDGYVAVFVAISSVAFILLAGFVIDVGTWYIAAARLQRAADDAALSGSVKLPSVTDAQNAAIQSFQLNGLTNSSTVNVHATADGSGDVSATVTNKGVPVYFLGLLFHSITITRTSEAQQLSILPLGSPYNIFGYGDSSIGVTGGIPVQHFWAGINGRCTPKEDGDYFASEWDGNEVGGRHQCDGQTSANQNNVNWQPDGYNYAVDIPAAATVKKYDISIWDPVYAPDTSASPSPSRPDVLDKASLDTEQGFNTAFRIWDTHGTPNLSDDTEVWSGTFVNGTDTGNDAWYKAFTTNGQYNASGIHYRIQVISDPLDDAEGGGNPQTGANGFALMASVTGTHDGCDSRTDDKCPNVYGMGSISVLNTFSSSNAGAGDRTFYLAKIDPVFAGRTMDVYLWDPGEGASSIQILAPDGTPVPFSWTTDNVPGVPQYQSAGNVLTLTDLSQTGPQPGPAGSRIGNTKFNDRLVELTLQVPTGYAASPGDQWWRVKYSFDAGTPGVARTDRTTWGINVGASTPVHLINGAN